MATDAEVEQTRKENEAFYDKEIAPALAELSKKCFDRGFPFLAVFGNKSDTYATNSIDLNKDSAAMRLIYYAIKCHGNVDALFMNIEKDAEKFGDNSVYLWQLKHYRKLLDPELPR